ncbi:MAG TPA: TerC/Alx family metal homeostasis membrane protein [Solirubrobacteraceae bacterium]
MTVSFFGWAATLGLIAGLVGFDLWHGGRRPHAVGLRDAAGWSVFYISAAVLFGIAFALIAGWDLGAQYFAGYVVEKSLSVDNLFVFVIIMSTFAVPASQQSRLLMIGILGALALRAVFIALGAAMLDAFAFTYLLFGLALFVTAVQLFRHRDADPSVSDNALVSVVQRALPVAEDYDGPRLVTQRAGRRMLTPLFVALVALASTDVLFALDSIPAVFGVTRHAYIVFAANAFALLGLRALFFLVSGLLDRLVYLSTGLAVILGFIALKLVLHFAHLHSGAIPEISTGLSLAVIATILAVTTAASLIRIRRVPTARAHAGSLRAHTDADAHGAPGRTSGAMGPAMRSGDRARS